MSQQTGHSFLPYFFFFLYHQVRVFFWCYGVICFPPSFFSRFKERGEGASFFLVSFSPGDLRMTVCFCVYFTVLRVSKNPCCINSTTSFVFRSIMLFHFPKHSTDRESNTEALTCRQKHGWCEINALLDRRKQARKEGTNSFIHSFTQLTLMQPQEDRSSSSPPLWLMWVSSFISIVFLPSLCLHSFCYFVCLCFCLCVSGRGKGKADNE